MMYELVPTIHYTQSSTRQLNGHWPALSTTSHNCYNFKSECLSTKHFKPTYCTSFVGQFQMKIELFLNEMVDNLAICHWNVCRHTQLIEDWTNPFWQLTNVYTFQLHRQTLRRRGVLDACRIRERKIRRSILPFCSCAFVIHPSAKAFYQHRSEKLPTVNVVRMRKCKMRN